MTQQRLQIEQATQDRRVWQRVRDSNKNRSPGRLSDPMGVAARCRRNVVVTLMKTGEAHMGTSWDGMQGTPVTQGKSADRESGDRSTENLDDNERLDALARAAVLQDGIQDRLQKAIIGEIIPRLLMAHDLHTAPKLETIEAHEISEFTRVLKDHDVEVATGFVNMLEQRGVNDETIVLELFPKAARLLGDMWLNDECSFSEVTIGLSSLERILMRYRLANEVSHENDDTSRTTLLVEAPGEQHVFGILIVRDLFRRAGWRVSTTPGANRKDILRTVREKWFTTLGLSVSCVDHLGSCANLVEEIRNQSRNPHILIAIGGNAISTAPEGAPGIEADFVSTNGRDAVEWAENAVSESACR